VILSTQARAAGIHLIIGNQQPYANIVPNEVKGNITFKLAGRQMTLGASMTALGSGRATRIDRIPGRMVCNNGHEEFDVQIAYATEIDIALAVRAANNYAPPDSDVWLLDDTQEVIPVHVGFGEELLIKTAMEELGGALKAIPLWEILRDQYQEASRPTILRMVSDIVSKGEIYYDGAAYNPVKQKGNFYSLVPLDDRISSLHSVSPMESKPQTNMETKTDQQYPGWRVVNPDITEAVK
jgi:DNA segregation ATPase FtsK/SpoIIIE-like protein